MHSHNAISRRRFLWNTVSFSAAAALTGCGAGNFPGDQDPVSGGVSHFLIVGDWGTSINFAAQTQVAQAMQTYAAKWKFTPDALLMLGDNFYGDMTGGVASPRWQTQFEQMYPASVFPGPAYAVPGNHDYQNSPTSKYAAELAYAQQGGTRWTMPARNYSFTYPSQGPFLRFLAYDSNTMDDPAQPWPPPDSSYYAPSATDQQVQWNWLSTQLSQPQTTPFTVVIGHHPVYSNGPHGDNKTLIQQVDPLLRSANVSLYLCGHDHDLQHLEFAGHPTSFVCSGAGGATLDTLDDQHGPFGAEVHGFTHLQVRADLMIVRHLDLMGNLLHKFTKTPAGVVTVTK